MARIRRTNRYCVDCGAKLVYYPRLSNPKAPNEHRILVYACPDCSNDFDKPKMFSIKRNQVEEPLETVEIEINQVQKNSLISLLYFSTIFTISMCSSCDGSLL